MGRDPWTTSKSGAELKVGAGGAVASLVLALVLVLVLVSAAFAVLNDSGGRWNRPPIFEPASELALLAAVASASASACSMTRSTAMSWYSSGPDTAFV